MKFKKKLLKINNSLAIVVPKTITDYLELKQGSEIECSILAINKEKIIISYRCKRCEHKFDSNDDRPYCSACDSESVDEVEE